MWLNEFTHSIKLHSEVHGGDCERPLCHMTLHTSRFVLQGVWFTVSVLLLLVCRCYATHLKRSQTRPTTVFSDVVQGHAMVTKYGEQCPQNSCGFFHWWVDTQLQVHTCAVFPLNGPGFGHCSVNVVWHNGVHLPEWFAGSE